MRYCNAHHTRGDDPQCACPAMLVLDGQAAPAGRSTNVETVTAERPNAARVPGEDYVAGAAGARAFRECRAPYQRAPGSGTRYAARP